MIRALSTILSPLEYYLRNFRALVKDALVEYLEDKYLEFIMGEAVPDASCFMLYIGAVICLTIIGLVPS